MFHVVHPSFWTYRDIVRSCLRAALLLLFYSATVVLVTWPGFSHPATCVLSHWDPPFHAWKLAFAARSILSGHLLPPEGNTNVLYPQSGAFFFEALHWPQALFAAPFLAAGLPPVLVYHIALVFFWALSGLAFRFWLRALRVRDPFASLGGLFFVLVPYRVSYAVEFNMQLCFALPLLFGAVVSYFRRPGVAPALLAAVAWWLQAVSELYQAVFVLVVLPFFLLPLFARDSSLFRSWRRFWRPALLAAALCAALSFPFLFPYFRTLSDGTLVREIGEMRHHTIEPFSWVLPFSRRHFLPVPCAHHDEMSVYPTLALLAASLFAVFFHGRRPRFSTHLFGVSASLGVLAAALLHISRPPFGVPLANAAAWLGVASVVTSVPCLLRRDRSVSRAAAVGIGAAAIPALLLSLGPDFSDSAALVRVSNPLFAFCSPLLGGFRVVSRFAVFPVVALCTAAAVGLADASSALSRLLSRRSRVLRWGLPPLLLVLFLATFVLECLPPRRLRLRRVRDVSSSAALAAYDALPGSKTLAVVPMGKRSLDSEHMLAIARDDRLTLWAWAGTFPRAARDLRNALNPVLGDPDAAVAILSRYWPPAYILEDLRPFRRCPPSDYAAFLGPRAEIIASDPEFRLFRLVPSTEPSPEAVRIVRHDLAVANPRATFTLSAPAPARVWLDVNGVPLASVDATSVPVSHTIDIPPHFLLPRVPQRYRFHADSNLPFVLSAFDLSPAAALAPLPDLPWLPVVSALPPSAIPLDVRYPRGIALRGVTPLALRPPQGPNTLPTFHFRLYLSFPPRATALPNLLLAPGYARDGDIIYKNPIPLRNAVDPAALPFAAGRLVVAELSLPVLQNLPPGVPLDISLDLLTPSGRRLRPRPAGSPSLRHLFLPLSFTPSP